MWLQRAAKKERLECLGSLCSVCKFDYIFFKVEDFLLLNKKTNVTYSVDGVDRFGEDILRELELFEAFVDANYPGENWEKYN